MFANALELLYDILREPTQTMYRLTHIPLRSEALIVFLLTAVISGLSTLSGIVHAPAALLVPAVILSALGLCFGAAFLHLAAILLGGDGDVRGLLQALPFASFPQCFIALLPLLQFLPQSVATPLASFLGMLLGLWSFYLVLLALQQNYRLSIPRSLLATILPGLAFFLYFILLFVIMAGIAAQIFSAPPELLQNMPHMPGVGF